MFLYKIECEIETLGLGYAVVVAESDLKAFQVAERIVHGQSLTPLTITTTTIVEKKPIKLGIGYALMPNELQE